MKKLAKPIRPDDVSDIFPEGAIKLTTRLLPAISKNDVPVVEIEGDALSLEYLAKLISAQAAFPLDCGYGIAPRGAGNVFFKKGSTIGIYIHRLPCMDEAVETGRTENNKKGRRLGPRYHTSGRQRA